MNGELFYQVQHLNGDLYSLVQHLEKIIYPFKCGDRKQKRRCNAESVLRNAVLSMVKGKADDHGGNGKAVRKSGYGDGHSGITGLPVPIYTVVINVSVAGSPRNFARTACNALKKLIFFIK